MSRSMQRCRFKAAETASSKESAEEEEAPEAPANLITTEVHTRPASDWKDVTDEMAALINQGCKQRPRNVRDTMHL